MIKTGLINLNVALEKQSSVLPDVENAGFWHVVWVILDVT